MHKIIRVANESDAAVMLAIYSPIVAETATSFECDPPSLGEFQNRICETVKRTPWLVCENDRRIMGYAYASEHRSRKAYQWSVDVSVYVAPDAQRAGVARKLYQSLFETIREQGYFNAFAGIALPNVPSVSLHESFGFTPIGVYRSVGFKLAAWHDVGWWQLKLRDYGPTPNPPTPFSSLKRK